MDYEEYIAYLADVRRYSLRTCDIYRDVLASYSAFAGDADEPLSVSMVRSYEVHLMEEANEGARTVNLHLSVLSGYCKYLMKKGLLASNPVRMVSRPRQEKRLPVFYREDAMDRYFSETAHSAGEDELVLITDPSDKVSREVYERRLRRLIVSLLYNTGMRRSELISLDVSSVDFSRNVLRVHGKGDKMREIPVLPSVCDEISLYLHAVSSLMDDAYAPGAPLLRTTGGARLYPVYVDRAVKRELGDAEGITGRKSPHVLRHTLATELLGDGTDLNSIKELLGHSSLAATQVYTHNSIERLQSVYNTAHPRAKNGGKNGD